MSNGTITTVPSATNVGPQTVEQLNHRIEKLEEQLKIVNQNLRRGLSKSMQKLQARCNEEVLDGNYE
jgi:uncharacterized FlaG/YvyC family protein